MINFDKLTTNEHELAQKSRK